MSLLESIAQWQGQVLKIAPPSDTNLLPAVGELSGPAFFPEGFGLGDPPLTLCCRTRCPLSGKRCWLRSALISFHISKQSMTLRTNESSRRNRAPAGQSGARCGAELTPALPLEWLCEELGTIAEAVRRMFDLDADRGR
jgi:hypothetical protein